MDRNAIVWPMVGHAALVFAVYGVLFLRRRAAVLAGTRPSQFRLRGNEPELSATAQANLANQFELPMLFHAACLALFAVGGVSAAAVGLAWLFIVMRGAHALVHLTSNSLRWRSLSFTAGYLALMALWACLALSLFQGRAGPT